MKNNTTKISLAVITAIALCLIGWAIFGSGSAGGASQAGNGAANPALPQTYTDSTYHFSFDYPAGLKQTSFPAPDGSGDVVLVSDSATGIGMQVYITPFDEGADSLTVARIQSAIPGLAMADAHLLQVSGGAGKGIEFRTGSGADEKAQEWFVAGSHLYQVTAPVSFAATLKAVLATWKFQ